MKKYFNIAGPCNAEDHYMLPSESRCKGIAELIDQKQYFVIHAARQSGKTTLLLELVSKLNDSGKYYALLFSRILQGIDTSEKGIPAVVRRLICAFITGITVILSRSKSDTAIKLIRKASDRSRVIWIRWAAMRAGWSYSTEEKNSRGKAGCFGKQRKSEKNGFMLSGVE